MFRKGALDINRVDCLLPHEYEKYGYILLIIRYEEIKEYSRVISDDGNIFTVQYGNGLASRTFTSDDLRKINMNSMSCNSESQNIIWVVYENVKINYQGVLCFM